MFIRNKRVLVKKQHIQCVVDNLILLPAFKDKDVLETVKLFSAHLSFIILILFAMNVNKKCYKLLLPCSIKLPFFYIGHF